MKVQYKVVARNGTGAIVAETEYYDCKTAKIVAKNYNECLGLHASLYVKAFK